MAKRVALLRGLALPGLRQTCGLCAAENAAIQGVLVVAVPNRDTSYFDICRRCEQAVSQLFEAIGDYETAATTNPSGEEEVAQRIRLVLATPNSPLS